MLALLARSYAPGKPDIGNAVHDTAFTGSSFDITIGIAVMTGLVLIAIGLLLYSRSRAK